MSTTPPPIGTEVSVLRTDGDQYPSIMLATVATGEVSEPAHCACHCVVKSYGKYFLVRDAADINPSEELLRETRVKWATSVIARASQCSLGAYEPKSELAERVLRGEA